MVPTEQGEQAYPRAPRSVELLWERNTLEAFTSLLGLHQADRLSKMDALAQLVKLDRFGMFMMCLCPQV